MFLDELSLIHHIIMDAKYSHCSHFHQDNSPRPSICNEDFPKDFEKGHNVHCRPKFLYPYQLFLLSKFFLTIQSPWDLFEFFFLSSGQHSTSLIPLPPLGIFHENLKLFSFIIQSISAFFSSHSQTLRCPLNKDSNSKRIQFQEEAVIECILKKKSPYVYVPQDDGSIQAWDNQTKIPEGKDCLQSIIITWHIATRSKHFQKIIIEIRVFDEYWDK